MQVNFNKAMSTLRSTENKIRAEINPGNSAKAQIDQALKDSVDIGGAGKTLSSGYVSLQSELADQLGSLTSLIGDQGARQKELTDLFGGAGGEDAVRARAQELLEGYFNVENTGNRIFDFAFSHYKGGDREAFAKEMQGYIHEGFAQAEKALGGLADISLETRDYIDQRVDDFINEGKEPEGEAVEGGVSVEVSQETTSVQTTRSRIEVTLGDNASRASLPDFLA